MSKKDKLGSDLARLAQVTVTQALEDGVDLETRLDVIKTAGTFYVNTTKAKAKNNEDDPDVATFDSFKNKINGKAVLNG